MNIRLEPKVRFLYLHLAMVIYTAKLDEPYLDMKQFISSVIRKWQRTAFGWQMIQVRSHSLGRSRLTAASLRSLL